MRMRDFIQTYQNEFNRILGSILATDDRNRILPLEDGIERACALIKERASSEGTLYFIGNGGSSTIASHMATDFWRSSGIRALTFNDSPLLTSIGNDLGYHFVFEKPIEMFLRPGDVLIAISSSGRSENILRGVDAAWTKGGSVITLSGFSADNPLRTRGVLNFFVPSGKYGPVEVIHQYLCHWILDTIVSQKQPVT
jgi:D-sedoheptulose 7-phosphate isomerase